MLRANQLSAAYGDRFVFQDLSLGVARSEVLFVSGANGSGKTTLLQILAGLRRPLSGSVTVDDKPVSPASPKVSAQYRSRVGYLGHEPSLYKDLTVVENLELFATGHGLGAIDSSPRVKGLIETFGLTPHLRKQLRNCSFGVAKKAAIVRAVMHEPQFLILDEPFAGLDKRSTEFLTSLLADRKKTGTAIVFSSHEEVPGEELVTGRIELGEL